jgi:hypothetical protein
VICEPSTTYPYDPYKDALQIPRPDTVEFELKIARRFWRKTSGGWHAIVLCMRDLKIAVAKMSDLDRCLTPEILDYVFGKDKKADARSKG